MEKAHQIKEDTQSRGEKNRNTAVAMVTGGVSAGGNLDGPEGASKSYTSAGGNIYSNKPASVVATEPTVALARKKKRKLKGLSEQHSPHGTGRPVQRP